MNIKKIIPGKLTFDNSELEKEYLTDYSKKLPNQSIFSVILGIILYSSFAYLDFHIVPDHVSYVWIIRALVVASFILTIVFIQTKYFHLHNQKILSFAAISCIGGLLMMYIPIPEISESRYYVGLMIAIPWLYVSLGLRTKNAFYINSLLLIFYNTIILYIKGYPFYIFLNNNYFLFGVSVISFTGGYLIERNRRLAFQQTEELLLQKNKADTANAAKTHFLAAASHDLRQPLQAMSLFLDALDEQSKDSGHSKLILKIKKSSAALEALLESILDISKLDAGAINIDKNPIKVQTVLDNLANEFTPLAIEKGIDIHFMTTSLWVNTDKNIIERILRNLISNAIRYTEKGRILIGCRRKLDVVTISVYDTGIGIDEDKTKIIFEEFHQLNNPSRDRNKGLGLGLSIVQRLSDLLKAKLKLNTTLNKGSMFSIELPRSKSNNMMKSETESFTLNNSLHGKTIVLVEDEIEIQNALKNILEEWGCSVISLSSSKDIESELSIEYQPDIILADYRLQNKETGVDVIHAIYHFYQNNNIPASIITGDTDPKRMIQAKESGFKVMHKPVSGGKLCALLSSLL